MRKKGISRKWIIGTGVILVILMVAIYVVTVWPGKNANNMQEVAEEKIETVANAEKEERMANPPALANGTYTIKTSDGQTLTVDQDGWKQYWDESKVYAVADTDGVLVPVPIGYSASKVKNGSGTYLERTVNTGFVIYEGEEEVEGTYTVSDNIATMDDNVKTAQYTRNQWVWVPVYDVNEMYGTDSNGKKWGKLYTFSSSGATADNWTETNGVMSITSSTGGREPDVIGTITGTYNNYDKDDYVPKYISEEQREKINEEMVENFDKTIESITKYGGFYIGRYETGGLNATAKVVKEDTNISSQRWYTMYRKCKMLNGTNENVITSMIFGCEWDRTLQWLVGSGNKTYTLIGSNSNAWGNYRNSTFKYTNASGTSATKGSSSTVIPSGSTEYTKANNVYDLAGNVYDWTLEAYGTNSRRHRGGNYNDYGNIVPAGNRGNNGPYYSLPHQRVQGSTLRRPVS